MSFFGSTYISDELRNKLPSLLRKVDAYTDDDFVYVTGELPGVKKADLQVQYKNELLIVKFVKRYRDGSKSQHSECIFVSPTTYDFEPSSGTVTLEDGILTVKFPKKPNKSFELRVE
jgi:HSP20 family molecular chaperone IbpA